MSRDAKIGEVTAELKAASDPVPVGKNVKPDDVTAFHKAWFAQF